MGTCVQGGCIMQSLVVKALVMVAEEIYCLDYYTYMARFHNGKIEQLELRNGGLG